MKTLDELIQQAKEQVARMTPEELNEMTKQQAESWVRAELNHKPRFKYVNSVKTYDSYEDYCNG